MTAMKIKSFYSCFGLSCQQFVDLGDYGKESVFDKSPARGYTINMTVEQFRHWLQKKIQELDCPEPDIAVCEGAASIVEKAAATALVLGLPDLYRKSKFKGQHEDVIPS